MYVTQTIERTIGYRIGALTAETYPGFLPYRTDDPEDTTPTGKLPRLLSIIITTLINAGDPSYDADTRTMTLDYGFIDLCQKLRIHSGGRSRQRLSKTLMQYANAPFPTASGTMKVAEDYELDDDVPPSRRWVRFTREYVEACTRNVRQIPLDALPRSIFALDVLAVTALYTPDTKRLRIPMPDLMRLIPHGDHRASVFRDACGKASHVINLSQNYWTTSVTGNEFQSHTSGITPSGSVTLRTS